MMSVFSYCVIYNIRRVVFDQVDVCNISIAFIASVFWYRCTYSYDVTQTNSAIVLLKKQNSFW